jgi:hypothetical protein
MDFAVDGRHRLGSRPCRGSGFLSPSRSSTASCAPVEAPEGTAARPKLNRPPAVTSTSTVGLPRLSRISRAVNVEESRSCAALLGRSDQMFGGAYVRLP